MGGVPGLTSADGHGEVPHGHVGVVGDAGELGVAVQHVARHAAVADLVPHVEARARQDAFRRDARVPTGTVLQLWRERERDGERERWRDLSRSVGRKVMTNSFRCFSCEQTR